MALLKNKRKENGPPSTYGTLVEVLLSGVLPKRSRLLIGEFLHALMEQFVVLDSYDDYSRIVGIFTNYREAVRVACLRYVEDAIDGLIEGLEDNQPTLAIWQRLITSRSTPALIINRATHAERLELMELIEWVRDETGPEYATMTGLTVKITRCVATSGDASAFLPAG